MAQETVEFEDWLVPYLRLAAEQDGLSVSAWISRAAQIEMYRREGDTRRVLDAEAGIDRFALAQAAELAAIEDRAERG